MGRFASVKESPTLVVTASMRECGVEGNMRTYKVRLEFFCILGALCCRSGEGAQTWAISALKSCQGLVLEIFAPDLAHYELVL